MNKKYVIAFTILAVLLMMVAGCKNEQKVLQEKQLCFYNCLVDGDVYDFCLEDCRLSPDKVPEEKLKERFCGDGTCQDIESRHGLCKEDCDPGCSSDDDCAALEVCQADGECLAVECKEAEDCGDNHLCTDNVCIEQAGEGAVADLEAQLADLKGDIQEMIDDIADLQTSLNAADGEESDKDDVQVEIDALDVVVDQLEAYKGSVEGYESDLEDATTSDAVATVQDATDLLEDEVAEYMDDYTSDIARINDDISDLEPTAKPDLEIDGIELVKVEDDTATFKIDFSNTGDEDISDSESFRIKITTYEEDDDEHDDTKVTYEDGLDADDDDDIEIEVDLEYDIEQYFIDNSDEDRLELEIKVEIDVDEEIEEEDEDNNEEEETITFDREDYESNEDPVAAMTTTPSPAEITAGESVDFDASTSSDSDGTISTYSWDFDDSDGITEEDTGSSVSKVFDVAGTFTVTLTVTDDDGAQDTETVVVTVS